MSTSQKTKDDLLAELARLQARVVELEHAETDRERAEERQAAVIAGLHRVLEIADELMACPDEDTLHRRAVELARDRLGLERCGLFIGKDEHYQGTYGTDRHGRTTDEHGTRAPKAEWQDWIDRSPLVDEERAGKIREPRWEAVHQGPTPRGQKWLYFEDVHTDWDGEKMVPFGRGWLVMTPFDGKERGIGVFFNDSAITGAPYDPEKQEVVAVYCSILGNIIERKRTEDILRRLRIAVEQSIDGIAVADLDGNIRFVNPAWSQMHGYSEEELLGRHLSIFHTEEQMQKDVIPFNERVTQSGAHQGDVGHIRKDGVTFPTWMTTTLLKDEKGNPIGLVGIARDITDRKRAEEALRDSVEKFRAVFEQAADSIVLVDPETGALVEFNDKAHENLGYTREEFQEVTIADIDVLETAEEVAKHIQKVIDNEVDAFETQMRTKGGEIRDVFVSAKAISIHGETFLLCIWRDITDRNRAEEERRQMEAQLQHAQKLESLGILAGGIAHDFNNLLVGILGNASLALHDLPPGSLIREAIGLIETSAMRAAELTNQMLAYSGKGAFVVKPLDLSGLVLEMTRLAEPSISKKVIVTHVLADDLPAVAADASQIHQVVMNLITNAAEAIGAEGGTITISTGVTRAARAYLAETHLDDDLPAGRYVYLDVADTGCGMDAETRSKVFDPFFTTKFAGRGLGLAATLGIVRGHRGAIKVNSEPGKGTTFRALFPASDQPVQEEQPAPSRTTDDSRATGTILVVDDQAQVLTVATRALECAGYTILTATDGHEAVRVFRDHADEIAATLLDLTMPGLDGVEAFEEIRRLRPDARVILSSGYSQQEATERFAGKGLSGFIQKPYRANSLVEKLREVIG